MKKLPYTEGDWIAVPLKRGGYAIGRVTRLDQRGGFIGYFFGPRRTSIPDPEKLEELTPKDAVGVYNCGDLKLLDDTWKVIGSAGHWEREQWPIPSFVRHEDLTERYWKVIYSDDDLNTPVSEEPISSEEAQELPVDGIYGAGAVEAVLDHRIE